MDGGLGQLPGGAEPCRAHALYRQKVRRLVAELEAPFDPREIKWRVANTTADKRRGKCSLMPILAHIRIA